jgi:hypothetical protein
MSTTSEAQLFGSADAARDAGRILARLSSAEIDEKLATRAIEDLITAVRAPQFSEIHKKLDELGRKVDQPARPKHGLFSRAAFASFFLAAGFAAGMSVGKTWPVLVAWVMHWPVTVAWVTQLFA